MKKDDLISRAAALDALDNERVDRNYGDVSPESVIKVIESIPAVDAVPVEWLKKVRKDASEGDSLDVGIAEVLDMWEKEQEAR